MFAALVDIRGQTDIDKTASRKYWTDSKELTVGYRGLPVDSSGWLEILLLTIPVAGYLTYRRVAHKESVGIIDVLESGFVAYLIIVGLVFLAVLILVPAYVATMIVMLFWSLISGVPIRELQEWSKFQYLVGLVWLFFAFKTIRYFFPKK